MDTAVCETDAELGVIDNDKVLQLYYQNPTFGLYLIKLVSQRLLHDYGKLHAASLPAEGPATPPRPGSEHGAAG